MNSIRRTRANSMVSVRNLQSGYFDISSTEQPMNLIEVSHSQLSASNATTKELCDVTNFDPFASITQIAHEGYKFSRNRSISHVDGTITYSYKCLGCNERINIYSDPTKTKYEILNHRENIKHGVTCKKYTTDTMKIAAMIQEMKSYAIALKENNSDYGPCQLLAKVLDRMNHYNHDNPHSMIPILKRATILNWFNEASTIKSSEMKRSNIPNDLEFLNNTRWVQMQCHIQGKTYIILAFNKMINYASTTQRLLLDGTFKSRPTDFAQVLNGVGYLSDADRYCPLFHILMEDQKAETYLMALKLVFMTFKFQNLLSIHTDFELAELLALRSLFRADQNGNRKYRIQGCLFHFTQRILLNLHELIDESLKKYITAFLNTPFLPNSEFIEFMEYMKTKKEIMEFYSYFKAQWGPNGRVNREFWAVPQNDIFMNLTNDGVERYNKEANVELDHPNFEHFLRKTAEIDTRILINIQQKTLSENNQKGSYQRKTAYEAKMEINRLFPCLFGKAHKTLRIQHTLYEEEAEPILDENIPFEFEESYIPKKKVKKTIIKRPGQKKKGQQRKKLEKRYDEELIKIQVPRSKYKPGTYKDRDNSEEEEEVFEPPKKVKKRRRTTE